MPQTANPAPGIRLMGSEESVSSTIFIPIRQQGGESSQLYLYYAGQESEGTHVHGAFEQKHAANGDLQEQLTVWTIPKEGSEPAKYAWQLNEQMPKALWVNEILTQFGNAQHGELEEFLARCLQDTMRDPANPFRAVFSTVSKPSGF